MESVDVNKGRVSNFREAVVQQRGPWALGDEILVALVEYVHADDREDGVGVDEIARRGGQGRAIDALTGTYRLGGTCGEYGQKELGGYAYPLWTWSDVATEENLKKIFDTSGAARAYIAHEAVYRNGMFYLPERMGGKAEVGGGGAELGEGLGRGSTNHGQDGSTKT